MDNPNAGEMPALPALYRPEKLSRGDILQRYLALHSQQSTLRRRLSGSQSPPLSPKSSMGDSPDMSSSEASSPSASPVLVSSKFPQLSPPAYSLPNSIVRKDSAKKTSQLPSISPIPEHNSLDEFELPLPSYQSKLRNINYEIKSTLTDLLNRNSVRNDSRMRLWIQTRLMDAELELKRQRRRRVSTPTPTIVLTPTEDEVRRVSV